MAIWNEIKQSSWMQRFVWLNVLLFVTGALVVPKIASITFTLLALAGIVCLVRERWPHDLTRAEKWLLLAFALYFIVGMVSYNLGIKTRLGWEILFRDIRFLFAIPVYLLLRRYPPPRWLFWSGLVIGTLAVLGVAVTDYFSRIGGWRADGATLSIVFGHLCVAMAMICASGAMLLHGRSRRTFLLSGLLGAGIAIILSGTRGAWVALTIVGSVLFVYWILIANGKQRLISCLGIVVIIVACGAVFHGKIIDRITDAREEINLYLSDKALITAMPNFDSAGCLNNPEFLELFNQQLILSGKGKLVFSIFNDPMLNDTDAGVDCPTNYAIKVENTSNYRAWFYTPSRSVVPDNICTAIVLVRGQGAFQIPGGPKYRQAIDSHEYKLLELHCKERSTYLPVAYRLLGVLDPGQILYYVPVARYPGEYHYFYASTSVGARFAMWHAAWASFLHNPLLGAGTGAFPIVTTELVLTGKAPGITAWFDHAHNDYLTALADRGLIGLATLLLLYGAPCWLFAGVLRRSSQPEPAAVAGLLVIGGFMISGLTETLFNHSLVITYYAVFISLLAVLSRQPPSEESSEQ